MALSILLGAHETGTGNIPGAGFICNFSHKFGIQLC